MHKVEPGQKLRVLAIQIAVAADADEHMVADTLSALLSESGAADPDSAILDWGYLNGTDGARVTAPADYEEGAFQHLPMDDRRGNPRLETYCPKCDGVQIDVLGWYDGNTGEPSDTEPSFDMAWCRDCGEEIESRMREVEATNEA